MATDIDIDMDIDVGLTVEELAIPEIDLLPATKVTVSPSPIIIGHLANEFYVASR
jgi:hypothetical protein